MKTINITEGVNLRLIEGDKFDYVTVSVLFRQPALKERATENSLLSLMFLSGSGKFKNRQLLEIKLEELEGAIIDTSIIKKGNEHIIEIYARFKPCYIPSVFSILSDIIFKPVFNNEDIEKSILKKIINSQINNKRKYAFNSFMENIYDQINGDGYVDIVDTVDINRHYKYVIENSIVDIMIVGGEEEDIVNSVKSCFSFSPRKIVIPLKKLIPVQNECIEEDDVVQAKLCVGIDCDFECKGEEYARLMIANDIFGSGASSKLYMQARESESLCYYITSRLFRFGSLIAVEAGISADNAENMVKIIQKAVEDMQNTDVDRKQLELSKTSIINGYRVLRDKPEALMNFYLNQIIAQDNRNIDEVIECIDNIDYINGAFQGFNVNTLYLLRGEV
jgi:hypothetical protein